MKRRWLVLVAVLLIIVVGSGCARSPKPSKKPAKPNIPEKISQGEGVEPVLKVFNVKENTVEEMKLEDYVAGVVAGEVENDWPDEALAAQAILARTYVLEFIQDKGGSKYGDAHVSTDFEEAQAWNPDNINRKIEKAIESTRGQVVTYQGDYIKAWFHSHAGGMTADAKEGLDFKEGNPPYIQVIKSPDEDVGPDGKRKWEATFSLDQVAEAVRSMGEEPGEITEISIAERGPSGRATRLKIGDATVPAASFRIAIGSTEMRSTLLTSLKSRGVKYLWRAKGLAMELGYLSGEPMPWPRRVNLPRR